METQVNKIMHYITYLMGSIFIILGIFIMLGSFISPALPFQFKWMVGIVLSLYGLFRIVYTIYKNRQSLYEDD
jgi:uncharacterized membrane protein HdeD (DUF308 family)